MNWIWFSLYFFPIRYLIPFSSFCKSVILILILCGKDEIFFSYSTWVIAGYCSYHPIDHKLDLVDATMLFYLLVISFTVVTLVCDSVLLVSENHPSCYGTAVCNISNLVITRITPTYSKNVRSAYRWLCSTNNTKQVRIISKNNLL